MTDIIHHELDIQAKLIRNLIRDLNDLKEDIADMNRIIEVIAEQYYDLKERK